MEELRTGVGNIFAQASNLFSWADSVGVNVESVAAVVAQAGAPITQGQSQLGEPTRPLTETLDLPAPGHRGAESGRTESGCTGQYTVAGQPRSGRAGRVVGHRHERDPQRG